MSLFNQLAEIKTPEQFYAAQEALAKLPVGVRLLFSDSKADDVLTLSITHPTCMYAMNAIVRSHDDQYSSRVEYSWYPADREIRGNIHTNNVMYDVIKLLDAS